jgi:glycosidase
MLSLISCSEDENLPVNAIVEPLPDLGYQQYGTPFEFVPNTEDIVMYEVNLRAFSQAGNLAGVTARLDQIQDLGVNVIWLMPIHPVGAINSVNSPYSVKNYKEVGLEYGTVENLRTLTDQAHQRGIAVILDWVANHTAWDNPWIENTNWYTKNTLGNIIHPAGTNWLDVADLNFDNFEMREAMIDAMKYWIYEANIDGFRCDYADGVPFNFWSQAFNNLKLIPNRRLVLFAEGNRSNHFNAGFDLNFGWSFYGALKNTFNGSSVSTLVTAHNLEYAQAGSGKHWVRFTTNHDESSWDATPISLFNGIDGALAASVITIATGGVPLIYGSQEVGVENTISFFNNSVIPWSQNAAMRQTYEAILQFYTQYEAARKGANSWHNSEDIFCLQKSKNNQNALFLVNVRNQSMTFNLPIALQNTTWIDVFTNQETTFGTSITFEPYQYFIYKKA